MAYTTIKKPSDYFNTKPYTGNGSSNALTGIGFQTDMIWSKNRSRTSTNHVVSDTVRGIGKGLYPDLSNSEGNTNYISAIGSDGYTIAATDSVEINKLNDTFASWNWKANGAGSANTAGSINSTVSANTTSGFSIVKWTGNGTNPSTVGHGLGVAPKMIIMKNTSSSTAGWYVYHVSNGASAYMRLNLTDAVTTSHDIFNDATPTSTVFSVNHDVINGSGNTIIAYCFAEKTGYSKFGSYTGNNNTDGTFVYTGFKPAFVMVKRAGGGSQNWGIVDNKRSNYNLISAMLNPNSSGTEGGNNGMDLLSNGLKMRSSDGNSNGYTDTHIYMAFAEAPLVGSNNVPCTAK